jgi:hypothetical protein
MMLSGTDAILLSFLLSELVCCDVRLTFFLPYRERDLLHKVFTEKRAGIYVGIDPTAPSMHVGHMLPFMVLAWGYVWGLPVTFLVSLRDLFTMEGLRTDHHKAGWCHISSG